MRQRCRITYGKTGKVWQLCLKIFWGFNISFYAEIHWSLECGVHLSSECTLQLEMILHLGCHRGNPGSQMGVGLSAGKLNNVMEQKETWISPHITKLREHKERINFTRMCEFWNFPGDASSCLDNQFRGNSSALLLCLHKTPRARCSVKCQTVKWGKQNHKAEKVNMQRIINLF